MQEYRLTETIICLKLCANTDIKKYWTHNLNYKSYKKKCILVHISEADVRFKSTVFVVLIYVKPH